MAVWLRIPLVHPEAMDPALDGVRRGTADGTVGTADPSGPAGEAGEGAPGKADGDVAGANAGGNGPAAGRPGGGEGRGGRAGVEDPWETWNTVRVMCEHKSW